MAGDPSKVRQWDGADVYIADVGTEGPTDLTSPWGEDWAAVGLLDGEQGFSWERDQQVSERFAWGGILVKRKKSRHVRTLTFVAMEDNDAVFRLVNPGSTRTTASGLTTATIKIPDNDEFALGMEMTEGNFRIRRVVARASVDNVATIEETEENPTLYSITVTLFPEADRTLYVELSGLITP